MKHMDHISFTFVNFAALPFVQTAWRELDVSICMGEKGIGFYFV
jgi:hypothetical protein